MIQENEVRIGNFVMISKEAPVKDEFIGAFLKVDEHFFGYNFSSFYPIPLTTAILEKCGFVKHEESNEYWTHYVLKNGWCISLSHHTEPSAGVEEGKWYHSDEYNEIPSLHWLQNYYFFSVKKELEINL